MTLCPRGGCRNTMSLPADFLNGFASAAFQVEGSAKGASILRQNGTIRKPIHSHSITRRPLPLILQTLIEGQRFGLENLYSFPTVDIPGISGNIRFLANDKGSYIGGTG